MFQGIALRDAFNFHEQFAPAKLGGHPLNSRGRGKLSGNRLLDCLRVWQPRMIDPQFPK
jgi:hypothetical protein